MEPRPRNNPSRQKHDEEKNKEPVKHNQDVEKPELAGEK
jgi:hypothetical protein